MVEALSSSSTVLAFGLKLSRRFRALRLSRSLRICWRYSRTMASSSCPSVLGEPCVVIIPYESRTSRYRVSAHHPHETQPMDGLYIGLPQKQREKTGKHLAEGNDSAFRGRPVPEALTEFHDPSAAYICIENGSCRSNNAEAGVHHWSNDYCVPGRDNGGMGLVSVCCARAPLRL